MNPLYVVGCALAFAACQDVPPLYPASAPIQIREACAVAERKCTACHDRERIVDARHTETEWRDTVDRMRKFTGSAISAADTDFIVRCLSYRVEAPLVTRE